MHCKLSRQSPYPETGTLASKYTPNLLRSLMYFSMYDREIELLRPHLPRPPRPHPPHDQDPHDHIHSGPLVSYVSDLLQLESVSPITVCRTVGLRRNQSVGMRIDEGHDK